MEILITIAHLADFAGSELYTASLVRELLSRGHNITIYSPILGKIAETIDGLKNVDIINDLKKVQSKNYDIVHIQHNITAWMVRKYFPKTPAIMGIHGILPILEQPPKIDLGISKYIVVSQEIADHLKDNYGIKEKDIEIIHNWVDINRFNDGQPLNPIPKRLLVISNHMSEQNETVYRKVCKERNIEFIHVGLPENPVQNVEDYIKSVDVVVTLGRGAMEAMSCGRNVIISDVHGLDGMVTPSTYPEIIKNNLSGRRYSNKVTVKNFGQELDKYNPAHSTELKKIVKQYHNLETNTDRLIQIYKGVRKDKPQISRMFDQSIMEISFLVDIIKDQDYEIRMLKR